MKIRLLPLSYAIRNLLRDPGRMLQTLAGSGMVVFLIMCAHALNLGMRDAMLSTGSPDNIMLLGAGSEESVQRSEVSEQAAGIVETAISGVYTVMGTRAVSPEIYHMAYLEFPGKQRNRGMIRGVTPQALLTHETISLTEGTFPGPGEIMAGRMAWKAFGVSPHTLQVGETLNFDEVELTVSGVFVSPGMVTESEIWMDLNELRTLAQRESVSAIVLKLGEGEAEDVQLFTKQRLDLELSAIAETAYYAKLSRFYKPVRLMVWVTAALIAISAVFGGLNTLYAAFSSRVQETATLQAIGFRRLSILVSFIQESMMASIFGTLLGALLAYWILANRVVGLSAGAVVLTVEPETLFVGLITGIVLGVIGAIPPAVRCLRPPLPFALRDAV